MNDVIEAIGKYPEMNPLRGVYEGCFRGGVEPCLPDGMAQFNALNALSRTLLFVREYSEEAYNDFINDKLVARDKDSVNWHNFISALCELSVIYTYLYCSDDRKSFVYEPKLIAGKKTNPEFSINIHGYKFCVEVKSPNLLKQRLDTQKLLKEHGLVLEADVRLWSLEQTKEIVGDTPVMGSLDNKLADFLDSAQKKFPDNRDDKTIHLLVICWDGYFEQACAALKSRESGLLMPNSYRKNDDGTPKLYPNVSHIHINTLYQGMIDWICGDPYYEGTIPVSCDPFNMRYYRNYVVDYNLDNPSDIKERFDNIVVQDEPIIDEDYVKSYCDEQRWIFA